MFVHRDPSVFPFRYVSLICQLINQILYFVFSSLLSLRPPPSVVQGTEISSVFSL